MQYTPLIYAPAADNAWSVRPGALSAMHGYVPLKRGTYGTLGKVAITGFSGMSGAGTEQIGYIFRKIDGSARFVVFVSTQIDEYNSAGTRTNLAAGFTAGSDWTAAPFGNAIIACNYSDATQLSSGAGFAGLGGGSPKARLVASNSNFVMLGNYDDGVNQYGDGVWWSAIGNHLSWTPSIATQAGNVRLLDAPGPIRALVAFKDTFVAFKDNAIFIGEYVGPPPAGFIFNWRMVSNRIGCVGKHCVGEFGGVLYFLHSSGVWAFDGANLNPIGRDVDTSILNTIGFVNRPTNYTIGGVGIDPVIPTNPGDITASQILVDDIEGALHFLVEAQQTVSATGAPINYRAHLYSYNIYSQKWGHTLLGTQSAPPGGAAAGSAYFTAVKASVSDIAQFFGNGSYPDARILMVVTTYNSTGTSLVHAGYPLNNDTLHGMGASSFSSGAIGQGDGGGFVKRVWYRWLGGTDSDSAMAVSVSGSSAEINGTSTGTTAGKVNTEYNNAVDVTKDGRYITITHSDTATKKKELYGVALDMQGSGRR